MSTPQIAAYRAAVAAIDAAGTNQAAIDKAFDDLAAIQHRQFRIASLREQLARAEAAEAAAAGVPAPVAPVDAPKV